MLRFRKDYPMGFNLEMKYVNFPNVLSFDLLFVSCPCSYYVEKRSRKGKAPVSRRSNTSSSSGSGISPGGGSGNDLFIVAVSMIAEKMRLAKQSVEGEAHELDSYMTVYFDYSTENDIPTMLSLATRWAQYISPVVS